MRILLVQPRGPRCRIGFYTFAVPEPLALEILAATVPDDEVRILDMRIDDDLAGAMAAFAPDLVAVTALTTEVYAAQDVLAAAKTFCPEVFTAVGGHHATLMPRDFYLPSVDAVGLGEGEAVFPQLVDSLKRGGDLKHVPNLIWRDGDGRFVHNGRSVPALDADALPLPRRDLVRHYRPHYFMLNHQPDSSVATGRGCPYRCNFCSVWEFYQGKTRQMSPGRVVQAIREVDTAHLTFVDDNFIFGGRREAEIARQLKAEGIKHAFSMECRTDAIMRHPEVIAQWAELGLRSVLLGLEGAGDESLASVNKKNTARANEEAVRILQDNGVNIWGAFIVHPDWVADDFRALGDYVQRLGIIMGQFTVLTPLPGTQLYRDRYAELLTHDYTCFDTLHSVLPTRLPREEFYQRFAALYHRPDPRPYLDLVDRGVWTLEQLKQSYKKTKAMRQWESYAENDPVLGSPAARPAPVVAVGS
jgi:hopanoid C-3 methylase